MEKLPDYVDFSKYPTKEELDANPDIPIALDTETLGATRASNLPIYYSWSAKDLGAGAGPVLTQEGYNCLARICACARPKSFHNIKFDIKALRSIGFEVKGELHCTLQAHKLLDPHNLHGLKKLAVELLGKERLDEDEHKADTAKAPKSIKNAYADQYKMWVYAKEDAADTDELLHRFLPLLKDTGQYDVYRNDVAAELAYLRMEQVGIGFDSERAEKALRILEEECQKLANKIYAALKTEPFNISSPTVLGPKLYEAGFPLHKRNKPTWDKKLGVWKDGSWKTDKDTLHEWIDDPRMQLVLAYRFLSKAASTLRQHLKREKEGEFGTKGRLFSEYRQDTATGRSACSGTPLQQIPKHRGKISARDVGSDELAELCREAFQHTRGVFVAQPGSTLVSIDYDQGEYRAAAHYSQSERLINIFKQKGDFHEETCKLVFGEYVGYLRNIIKIINFGLLYGMGVQLLAQRIKAHTSEDPLSVLKRYEENLPEMRALQDSIIFYGQQRGWVKDVFGRRYYPPPPRYRGDDSTYKLVSYLCQGTVAQIKKHSLVRVDRLLQGRRSAIVADIHDELVFEMFPEDAHLIPEIIRLMQDYPQFSVPFTCSPAVGFNLLDTSEMDPEQAVHFVQNVGKGYEWNNADRKWRWN